MNGYAVTLVGPLSGYYIVVVAPSEMAVRRYCANYLGRLWCSVYENSSYITEQAIGNIVYVDQSGDEE